MTGPSFRVVIPSRYGATRLPGKPLRLLAGRPLIEHVWRRAVESAATTVIVATDDERVRAVVEGFGGVAWMTSPDLPSGTDRIAAVAARGGWADDEVVVNLQGDEPCMPPAAIRAVAMLLAGRPADQAAIATCATPIREPAELFDPAVVKVVVDDAGLARWFSRAPIPWVRGRFEPGAAPPAELPEAVPFLRHLGLYAYRAGVLGRICAAPPHPHERAESLEQLRALCLGIGICVRVLEGPFGPGVDTEADLRSTEAFLARRTAG
ncbi:MAG: 3-deoxy-manno-octulosonate cytidylyltransferase [Deltaproteobacteria bacterium]|nr:3-deoxy-manno-octulosonate cytidylyltransferase [Deltaproteobacteria bacterium]